MQNPTPQKITVSVSINAPIQKVWAYFTEPEKVMLWNNASPDWHTPFAENDLRIGGKFVYRMEAKDGSFGFDFGGKYDQVILNEFISYVMDDGRKVTITFKSEADTTDITEVFDAEMLNPIEMQRNGWQSILDNFKDVVEKGH